MFLSLLLAAAAWAAPAAPPRHTEETLRVKLAQLRQARDLEVHKPIFGAAEELRDAVSSRTGSERKRLAGRLPGMAEDPFNLCRALDACPQAPLSLHVEDQALVDDAFVALARPWFQLQKARGKAVTVKVDPGQGVVLELEDLAKRPKIVLEAMPTPTGGFDVALDDGPAAAEVYASERAAALAAVAAKK